MAMSQKNFDQFMKDYNNLRWEVLRKRWPEYSRAVPLEAGEDAANAWIERRRPKPTT